MIQLILLPLLASPLAHASIMGGDGWKNSLEPIGTVEKDTIKPCFYWVNDAEKEDCDEIKAEFKITQEQLTSWNPSLGADCSGIKKSNSYCLNISPRGKQNATTTTAEGDQVVTHFDAGGSAPFNLPPTGIPLDDIASAIGLTKATETPTSGFITVGAEASQAARVERHEAPALGDPTWTPQTHAASSTSSAGELKIGQETTKASEPQLPVTTIWTLPMPTDKVVSINQPKASGMPSSDFTPPLDTRENAADPMSLPCKDRKRTLRRGTRNVESLDIETREEQFQCSKVHVSQPGDSCKSVAEKNGITTDQFIAWNNLGKSCEKFFCGQHNYYCVSEPKRP